ncbi:WD repeat-containing protein 20-like isoform X1 [Antedon mediterranea]|uniref:WD repeat-containing protein 20-like isoform X1 n=1 Tax=Antedon mediterranea TaxID=105859 RepID=UPI003AF75D1E
MAASDGSGKDEVKTQFTTREGLYKLMTLSEYSRPTRAPYNVQCCHPVKVSFVVVKDGSGSNEKICFNVGRELYFYLYKGVRKAADLTKPIDKRTYKGGTLPTCHDLNQFTASENSVLLLIGFSAGQVQLIDPVTKDLSRIFNDERLIDKTKVTCVKWVPGTEHMFLVGHASGQLYVYNKEHPAFNTPPQYQTWKHGDDYAIYTCKTKSNRNPVFRWIVGEGSLNEFAFSPDVKYLATVSQDGFLRIFNYDTMDLVGSMKSYFGGLQCVSWSPDSKYVVVGGEDDLVTVWSFVDKRVVARGKGHKSWVTNVCFDPFTSEILNHHEDFMGSEDDFTSPRDQRSPATRRERTFSNQSRNSIQSNGGIVPVLYRFGSVAQDTQLCLWEFTEDLLKQNQSLSRQRTNTQLPTGSIAQTNSLSPQGKSSSNTNTSHHSDSGSVHSRFSTLSLGDKHKDKTKKESVSSKSGEKMNILSKIHQKIIEDSAKAIGTPMCPRIDELIILEPLITKKIAHERVTSLMFKEDCIVTACQEGFVSTWARPGKVPNLTPDLMGRGDTQPEKS